MNLVSSLYGLSEIQVLWFSKNETGSNVFIGVGSNLLSEPLLVDGTAESFKEVILKVSNVGKTIVTKADTGDTIDQTIECLTNNAPVKAANIGLVSEVPNQFYFVLY